MKQTSWFAIEILLFVFASPSAAQSFHPLNNVPGDDEAYAGAISADGTRVFGGSGLSNSLGPFTAVQWTAAGVPEPMAILPPDHRAIVWAATADGSIAVGQVSSGSYATYQMQAFRWTGEAGLVPLGDLPGGDVRSFAYGVSDDGQTVVGSGTRAEGISEAFRWMPSQGMQGLGFLPGKTKQSHAYDVSGDGSVVVGFSSRFEMQGDYHVVTQHEAFRWTAATGMIGLGDLEGGEFWSIANAVTDDGSVIVGGGWGENGTEAFRWTAETGMVGLGMLPSESGLEPYSEAYGVSGDGSIIVGVSTGHAMVWDERHGLRTIASLLTAGGVDLGAWRLLRAVDVSADGRVIIGYGVEGDGSEQPWVAVLPDDAFAVPEPAALAMTLVCVVALMLARSEPQPHGHPA
jgi:probable HAF family extracellular repeat protein